MNSTYGSPMFKPNYQPQTNTISAFTGTPEMRHEVGHWAQYQKAKNNPLALNAKTILSHKLISKVNPDIGQQIAKDSGRRELLSELQAHVLASEKGIGGRRLQEASRTTPDLGRIHQLAEEFRNHPLTSGKPGIISTVEHLMRNKGV
jgi:hypothetical protein